MTTLQFFETSKLSIVLVFVGGGIGSVARWGVSHAISSPANTLIVNILASLMIGLLYSGISANPRSIAWLLFLGVGFCGGLSTFSTFALEFVKLLDESKLKALLTLALNNALAIGAVYLGSNLSKWLRL